MQTDGQAKQPEVSPLGFVATIGVLLIATLLGSIAGAFMAWVAPSDKFSWAGIVVAPLWLILEVFLGSVSGAAYALSKVSRALSIMAVLGGFYVAWFYLRGI